MSACPECRATLPHQPENVNSGIKGLPDCKLVAAGERGAAERQAQGLAPVITDKAAIARAIALLTRGGTHSASTNGKAPAAKPGPASPRPGADEGAQHAS